MVKMRSLGRIKAWRIAATLIVLVCLVPATAQEPSPTPSGVLQAARPLLLLGVAIDEAGMAPADMQRSQELALALMDGLPKGSQLMVASFAGEKRIVLTATADRALVTTSLKAFEAGASGVALPDGLFDMVEYLGAQEADSRVLLLFSAGRVRDGDLQFEDPLNAATAKGIPIFALALGQGEGKLLRRIAKITGGEYVRLEVADAAMLAQSILQRRDGAKTQSAAAEGSPESPSRAPAAGPSTGLFGAAAVFFSLGGLLMLGIVVLLIRRMSVPAPPPAVPVPPTPSLSLSLSMPRPEAHGLALDPQKTDDEEALEKTMVVNANPTLRALSGPGAGKNFPLSPAGHTTLGRSRRNDIVVPEDAASAQHCRIDREGDSYVVHDLGSTNGTWLNDARTERAVLQHGDRLRVGGTVFAVSLFGDRT